MRFLCLLSFVIVFAQNPFEQIDALLPTPNVYRDASGAPGPQYWQQQADYLIHVKLIDSFPQPRLQGKVVITYHNNAPRALQYLWIQLDQNIFHPHSLSVQTQVKKPPALLPIGKEAQTIEALLRPPFQGGYRIHKVLLEKNKARYHIYDTMMRIDLPQPLKSGSKTTITIVYDYFINDATKGGRSGYEYFEKDKNYLFVIAQFYPRMCAYTDVRGWQNNPYIGRGEFALEFGNYEVFIDVPDNYVVAATGVLQNPEKVLAPKQRQRLEKALKSEEPVFIITPEEAKANEKTAAQGRKIWHYKAEKVRDFAFAASKKFIWDASGVTIQGKRILVQALYPKEALPLWQEYANHAVRHALKTYSKYVLPYPYPHATAVHGPVWGMEYPMLAFCGGRPDEDGYATSYLKYSTISVIIHEVGHNWFPMIINNDERQWAWLDEGLNSFVEFLAEMEFEPCYYVRRGPASRAIPYMKKEDDQPIMTRPEEIVELGNNAYTKVAAALTVLRETILGRERFDSAFQAYARRWAFKRPEPADFFRTMEDVSGQDLDWFWRAWFFSTDHVDIALTSVQGYPLDEKTYSDYHRSFTKPITLIKNLQQNLSFYRNDAPKDCIEYRDTLQNPSTAQSKHYLYLLTFENRGGIVMPLIYRIYYEDGTTELVRAPVEVWLKNPKRVQRSHITTKRIVGVWLDPYEETADADTDNNWWGIVH